MSWACISYRGTVDNFTKQFVCEVTPQANSPSPEFALEIAPLIHSAFVAPNLPPYPTSPTSVFGAQIIGYPYPIVWHLAKM